MKLFYTVAMTLMSVFVLYAQWTNQNPVPNGNNLYSIFFIDDNTGWIAGSEGFIMKTTNAGKDWIHQTSGTLLTLRSVQFINPEKGWICGDGGIILKTSNGGDSWYKMSSGTSALLTDLCFQDQNTGWIAGYGGTILKTTNGGTSWAVQLTDTSLNLNGIDFVSSFVGYAVGNELEFLHGHILKTTDGGTNWINITPVSDSSDMSILGAVDFIDEDIGWVGDDYDGDSERIWKTTNGGETWTQQPIIPFKERVINLKKHPEHMYDVYRGIRSIYFKDSENGYAVAGSQDGWDRMICTTTNGGSTWIQKYFGGEEDGLISVIVTNSNSGWAVGFSGAIFITEDNGINWAQILSGNKTSNYNNGDDIFSVYFINQDIGWAVGKRDLEVPPAGDVILKTTNGGKIWKTQLFDQASSGPVRSVYFLNESTGWATSDGYGLFLTTDGGENWNYGSPIINSSVYFINSDTGWATSNKTSTDCGIYKSTNAGLSWTRKSSISSTNIYFTDNKYGWAVGPAGGILRSTDGGETWIEQTGITTNNINAIYFLDRSTGICVGDSGTVLVTTDGGQDWNFKGPGTNEDLNSLAFMNTKSIWITGNNGTILQSTDLGNTWFSFKDITSNNMTSIFFINENSGWLGGSNGTVIRYQNQILPVELYLFTARMEDNRVFLHWQTATELNNFGFEIERRNDLEDWNKIGFVESHGNSTSTQSYYFYDNGPFTGNIYNYRIKEFDNEGNFKYSTSIEVEIIPQVFTLSQNYPNPFNPVTNIEYNVPRKALISVIVYNLIGQKIAELVNGEKNAGTYIVKFDASGLPSGIYFYTLRAESFVQTKKMILLR